MDRIASEFDEAQARFRAYADDIAKAKAECDVMEAELGGVQWPVLMPMPRVYSYMECDCGENELGGEGE